MRPHGWAGEGLLPVGWPAGHITSPVAETRDPLNWRRIVFGPDPTRTLRRVLAWAACTVLLFHYLLVPIKVMGVSMSPTYRDGAVNLINRLAYSYAAPKRGDVVVINDGEDLILKRIVAIPGETVTLDRGRIRINGVLLKDQFSLQRIQAASETLTLGQNEYFVIGDNREASMFGKFPQTAILGKIVF
jgi:signal peptidase I